jgi:tripartite-type tricarboxylate transporter receptor subunit TctC
VIKAKTTRPSWAFRTEHRNILPKISFTAVAYLMIAGAVALSACSRDEAHWPSRPIKLEVGYPPAGGADALARLVAGELGHALNVETVVENRPGSAGTIAAQYVARAPKDGYTLLVAATGAVTLAPLLDPRLPYSPERDLCPLALLGETPHVLLVRSDSPAKTLEDLIALSRAKSGEFSYASLGTGSSAHAIGALFADAAGISVKHIPYRGSAPAINDLIGGHVSMMFGTLQATLSMIASGQVRALAVSGKSRSARLPSVPTFAERGLESLTSTSWYGLFAPCGLPRSVADRLDSALRDVINRPALAAMVRAEGGEFRPVLRDDFGSFLRAERARWARAAALLAPRTPEPDSFYRDPRDIALASATKDATAGLFVSRQDSSVIGANSRCGPRIGR